MSKFSEEDILKLAKLSRLKLTPDEVEQYAKELSVIVEYVEKLQGIDLGDTPQTNQVTGLVNVMRSDDIVDYKVTPKDLLKNAPATKEGHFKVKRMID